MGAFAFWLMIFLIWAFCGLLVVSAFGGIGAFLFVIGTLAAVVIVSEA